MQKTERGPTRCAAVRALGAAAAKKSFTQICVWGCVVLISATLVSACSLYFGKTPVATDSLATCYSYAGAVARQKLHNVRTNRDEVAGETADAYASITCIAPGRGQQAIAVVMVVSNSATSAATLRDVLVTQIKGTRGL